MPGLDRTGPMGAGSMTGGGRGLCGRTAFRVRRPPGDFAWVAVVVSAAEWEEAGIR